MKKVLIVVLILVSLGIALVAGMLIGSPLTGTVGSNYNQLQALSISAENELLKELGIEFPDAGNAADLYIPYLAQDAEKIIKEGWIDSARYYGSDKEDEKEKLKKAVELASDHLDVMLKASRMAECKVWGPHFKPNPEATVFAQDFVEYLRLLSLGELLVARGRQLAEAGENEQAVEHFKAVVRMGHHIQQDPFIFGFMIGIAQKKIGADALIAHYSSMGLEDEAVKWKLYADIQKMRGSSSRSYYDSAPRWTKQLTRTFVMDEDMPYSFRMEVLGMKRLCSGAFETGNHVALFMCVINGPPEWIDPLVDEFGAKDELSGQFAKAIKSHDVTFSDFQMIGSIE